MDKDKKKRLQDKGYKVEDYTRFLDITPEDEERILRMVNEARLKWEMEK